MRSLLTRLNPTIHVSAAIKNQVICLIESGASLSETLLQLIGIKDEHAQYLQELNRNSSYPMEMTARDIRAAWIFFDLLKRIKLDLIERTEKARNNQQNGQIACFHGTTLDRLKSIQKNGLKPNQPTVGISSNYPNKNGYVFVYTAPETQAARESAVLDSLYSAGKRGVYPIVFQLYLPPSELRPDLNSLHLFAYKIPVETDILKVNQVCYVEPWKVLSYWWHHLRKT